VNGTRAHQHAPKKFLNRGGGGELWEKGKEDNRKPERGKKKGFPAKEEKEKVNGKQGGPVLRLIPSFNSQGGRKGWESGSFGQGKKPKARPTARVGIAAAENVARDKRRKKTFHS